MTTPVWAVIYAAPRPGGDTFEDDTFIVVMDMVTGEVITTHAVGVPNEQEGELPARAELYAGYPNPFNPRTTLPFALPAAQRATVKVYDALGREVATLVDGVLPAGAHEAVWDAAGAPSGVYLVRLEAGGATRTQTLVLMK